MSKRQSKHASKAAPSSTRERKPPVDGADEDTLKVLEFECANLKKATSRKFETEARRALGPLPDKASVPKEILGMSVYEFFERGGTFQAVVESLLEAMAKERAKREKVEDMQSKSETLAASSTVGTQGHALSSTVGTRGHAPSSTVGTQGHTPTEKDFGFVTPAVGTRAALMRPEYTGNVTKRKPRPMEQVNLVACSDVSGSPVDEQTFMQLQLDQALEDMKSQLIQSTAKFPQKYRSQLMKSLRGLKNQAKMQENKFVTPAIGR